MAAEFYDVLYYVYVFVFGTFVSMRIACGAFARRMWRLYALLCPAMLIVQGIALGLCGMDGVWRLYPLIVHLPLMLILTAALRVKWYVAAVSVIISYSLCQLLRWLGLLLAWMGLRQPAALLVHLAACQLLLLLLDRYCLEAIHEVLASTGYVMCCFSAPPVLYYACEYFMLYTGERFADIQALSEIIPTAMVLFFTLFSIAFSREMKKSRQVECQAEALEMELSYAQREIASLRAVQERTAIYRHDLRHHLTAVKSLLSAGGREQADTYIREVEREIDALVPARYCGNETINLLLGAFAQKAEDAGVALHIRVTLPETLDVPDTELCSLLLNGLENALKSAAALPGGKEKTIDVFGDVRQNTLLLEIRNPCREGIRMRDGVPQAEDGQQHYGCLSIQSIVERRKGICTFEATQGVFVLRIALPLRRDGTR